MAHNRENLRIRCTNGCKAPFKPIYIGKSCLIPGWKCTECYCSFVSYTVENSCRWRTIEPDEDFEQFCGKGLKEDAYR